MSAHTNVELPSQNGEVQPVIPKVNNKRNLNLFSSILVLICTIVGTGIFMNPQDVVALFPSIFYTLLMWFLGGVISICLSLCYAELSGLSSSCGGEYDYFNMAYHEMVGFAFILCNFFILKPMGIAILILFTVQILFNIIKINGESYYWLLRLASIGLVILLCIIHCFSNRISLIINNTLTYLKFAGMGTIVGIALYKLGKKEFENVQDLGLDINFNISNLAGVFRYVMWGYDGFNQPIYLVEEMINPEKNMLLSLIIGVTVVILTYLIMNMAYFTIYGVDQLKNTTNAAIAMTEKYLGDYTFILSILIALSALGSANATAYAGARIYFDAARNGHVPRILAAVHKTRNTVIPSLIAQALFTIIYLLSIPNLDDMLEYFSGAAWVFYGLTVVAVIVLRYRRPGPRIFKVAIIIPLILTIIIISFIVMIFVIDWKTSLISVVVILVSFPIYLLFLFNGGIFKKMHLRNLSKSKKEFDKFTDAMLLLFNLEVPTSHVE
ncbi:hypothetical protein HZS_5776 [Henneguya salminicola]|nr:hypothetical protein HZS_5776 [Henneguya salminicola]